MCPRRMRKLNYRVVFPFELKLRNTSDDCANVDDFYDLFAVVVHVGQGPNHGELPAISISLSLCCRRMPPCSQCSAGPRM